MTDPQDMDYNAINESFPEQTRVIDLQFIPNAMISFQTFSTTGYDENQYGWAN